MSDTGKSCLGFTFLFVAIALALLAVFAGGLGSIVTWLGGDSFGINFKSGAIIGIGSFTFFFALSVYFFIKTKDLSWLPAILGTLYAVLPDLLAGSLDDIVALLLGTVLSGFLSWRSNRRQKKAEQLKEK